MLCKIKIDDQDFSYEVEGDFQWGDDDILFKENESIIRNCSWKNEGFNILNLIDKIELFILRKNVKSILLEIFDEIGLEVKPSFDIEKYHQIINSKELHTKVIERTRFLTRADFSIDWDKLKERISKEINWPLDYYNPLLQKEIIILRISRPNTLDINPPHRDGYLDVWKDVLNIWLPIAGCNERSSLPLIPGSHYWNEKNILRTANKTASINGLTYHVPAIGDATNGLTMIRPTLKPGEALIFTPFLIHGSALNLNEDITRFSLELRLFDKTKL